MRGQGAAHGYPPHSPRTNFQGMGELAQEVATIKVLGEGGTGRHRQVLAGVVSIGLAMGSLFLTQLLWRPHWQWVCV